MIVVSNSLFTCKSLHEAIDRPQRRPKYDQCKAAVNYETDTVVIVSLLAIVSADELKAYHKEEIEKGYKAVKPCLEISICSNENPGDYEHQRIDSSH